MDSSVTKNYLNIIQKNIQQIEGVNEDDFKQLLINSSLFSLTQPVFFKELKSIFNNISSNKIKGIVIESGVWCGATAIYLHALNNYFNLKKKLYLLDNFGEELNHTLYKHEKDKKAVAKFLSWNNVKTPTLNDVKNNFKKFNLLDKNVVFIKGDVYKTYHQILEHPIALLRIDLDFYEPTYFMLQKFYSNVSRGGYVIIDDYGVEEFNCKDAVDKFRAENNILSKLIRVGNFVAYWKKET